ncbi:MAG TPA: hypothetical protein VHU92_07630 [Streptosporangiaceae bacterium]|jgi:hypothetical protein|nr:hypothetical protein [Streptosporangiaceae bacterium]
MSSAQDKPGYAGPPAGGRTAQETAGYREADYQTTDYGYTGGPAQTGFTVLAGMLMILGGLWGFFEGLIAIIHQSFYATTPHGYTYQFNVHGWGWIHLILGVVIVAAGVCVLLGQTWAKLLGIVLAAFSGIANFLFIPYYPIWSIILIAMDVVIIWALASGISQRHQAA